MGFRLGVDIGGTFTDFCLFDEDTNTVRTLKVLSTPDAPGQEVVNGLAELERRHGIAPNAITYFTHGTTVGVNAVLQRKGINLCLFTTSDFEDVLEVARLKMPDPYDLFSRRPEPLVSREKVFGVRERTLADGTLAQPVDESSVLAAIASVRALGGEGIVIALLHAYRNPTHEREVRAIIERAAPDLQVSCSSDVWPVIREYERTVTAVIAGYVQPRVSYYLEALQEGLRRAGVSAQAMITKSNGGVMSAETGKRECAQMLLSGTAAGVIGACHVAVLTDSADTMSLDVGGTSADVAFIRDGAPQYGVGEHIGEFPLYIPTVSVSSIGEGGGSIAWVDDHGVLKVGPHSAGSQPGPACYGRGGEHATLTDAFVVSGFLGGADLGYAAVRLDVARAHAVVNNIGVSLGLDVQATAQAIIEVAVSGMYMEVSKLLSRYGIDARDLSLQAFGGAGPMIGCFLARELGIKRIVVPLTPGVLSAFGGLIAEVKNDFIRTVFLDATDDSATAMRTACEALRTQANAWLRDTQGFGGEARLVYSADMRYRGQSFEIETPLAAEQVIEVDMDAICAAFHREHERVFGHSDAEAAVQVVNLRLVIAGVAPTPQLAPLARASGAPVAVAELDAHYDGTGHRAALYQRDQLLAGQHFEGPAIIAQADCTTCVLHGWRVEVDGFGNLIITA